MWTKACSLLLPPLLLVSCLRSTEAQGDGSGRQSIWGDAIKFNTKANDLCTMIITGHGEYTRLRLSCQGGEGSYWCEYEGKPHTCRSYNQNPRHFFVQMMWDFRKLHNACQGPRQLKPQMCRKSAVESQMVFSSASFSHSWPEDISRTGQRPTANPASPPPRPVPARTDAVRQAPMRDSQVPQSVETTTTTQPTTPPVESNAKRAARRRCWSSLRGVCSFFIGLFQ